MVYLDCNATTPMEPEVREVMLNYMDQEFGNGGSRTHHFGLRARQGVEEARSQIAEVVNCGSDEVIFTSGATESSNLAILGLKRWAEKNQKKHVISTQIEHKCVLEPLEVLSKEGFDIELIRPNSEGHIEAKHVKEKLRKDTCLVSVMHVNNETGIVQPIQDIAESMLGHDAFLFVDAAQSFGKIIPELKNKRIDLISASAHKIYGPKGIGCLVIRNSNNMDKYLSPILYGGGQENGLRPGTLAIHQIAGFGKASELALKSHKKRDNQNKKYKEEILKAFYKMGFKPNGNQEKAVNSTVNLYHPKINSEPLIIALRDLVAFSNGSACTSSSYKTSYVLEAMGLSEEAIVGGIRLSWCHFTKAPNYNKIQKIINGLF